MPYSLGGGTAIAGQSAADRGANCEARVAKFAEKHGLTVAEVEAKAKARLTARVDAALQAGRIAPERAAHLKDRIAQGSLCQRGHALEARLGRHRLLAAAASFLGLNRAELRAALPGTSLSALAEKQGKSLAGLKAVMIAPAEAKLAKAVETKRISQERADRLLDRVENRVDRLVARTFRAG